MASGGTIFVSDKLARLKPCLRCGYSLRGAISAKNCPECGLAVRISLSSNRGLEWSNPRWQRFMAFAFGVLGFGLSCKTVASAGFWVIYGITDGYYELSDPAFAIVWWLSEIARQGGPIACGSALCLMAKGEGRHPDDSRVARRIILGAGMTVLSLAILGASVRYGLWRSFPSWGGAPSLAISVRPMGSPGRLHSGMWLRI